jgi:hypothetical protein
MAGIVTTSYVTPKQILIAPELAFTISAILGNAGISADSDGKKIIKAGSPISGTAAANMLVVRTTVGILDDTATAKFVLVNDVDVTAGNNNGTLLVSGFVDINKLGTTPSATAQTALTKITFVKGD